MTDEIHQTLGEWVLSVAPDYEREFEDHVDDRVDWSMKDAHVSNAEFMKNEGVSDSQSASGTSERSEEHCVLLVNALTVGTAQRQTRRATRWEPAEHENVDVDIAVTVEFHFDGMGYAMVRAEQFDYPFEPEVPEPREA